MKNITLILFLISTNAFSQINILDKSAAPFSSSSNSFYSCTGTKVFKYDSLGNSIWVKDFTGYIMDTSVFPNRITGMSFDGSYLYIQEIQGPQFYNVISHFFPAIIVLDTNGNTITIRYRDLYPGSGSYSTFGCKPSLKSGAWFIEDFSPGHTHWAQLIKIDSGGTSRPYKRSAFFFNQSVTQIKFLIPNPDSSYLVVFFSYFQAGSTLFPSVAKIFENGTIAWVKSYSITNERLDPIGIAPDSTGHIYLMMRSDNYSTSPSTSGACILKLDSSGNIIDNRLWNSLIPPVNGNHLLFKNDEIIYYYDYANYQFHLDTNLNSTCLGQGISRTFYTNEEIYTYGTDTIIYNYSSNFAPVDSGPIHITIGGNMNLPDSCNMVSVSELASQSIISISPNPASGKINFLAKNSISEQMLFSLFDLTGRVVLKKRLAFQEEQMIDISKITSGIYLAEILMGVVKINKKIVIEN